MEKDREPVTDNGNPEMETPAEPDSADAAVLGDLPALADLPAPAARRRSPVVAAILSFLWPGLGQAFQGRYRLASAYLLAFLAVVAWFVVQLGDGLVGFGLSMFDESFAATVALVVVIAALIRVAAVLQPLMTRPQGRRSGIVNAVAALVLLLAILVPHGYVAGSAWLVHQADIAMAQNDDQFAEDSPSPSPSPSPTPTASPTVRDTSPFFPATTPAPSIGPTAKPVVRNRITFLLLGIDFMTGRKHHHTDTVMVATVDTKTYKVTMISVPRDTAAFDLYYGGWVGTSTKLNTLLASFQSGAIKAPDKPMTALKKEIGFLVGIPIDYYAAVDLEGFPQMIDAVGGIDFDNHYAINDPFTGTFIPKGPIHLDGETALKYVRSRESSSDYQRAARQQDVIVALEQKFLSPEILPNLPALITLAGQIVSTDFPLAKAKNYVNLLKRIKTVTQCVLQPPYSYHPDSTTTNGSWTSRLDIAKVAGLSVYYFGAESRYYRIPGIIAAPCHN
jgi:LCP family protein required for cell wall assembly